MACKLSKHAERPKKRFNKELLEFCKMLYAKESKERDHIDNLRVKLVNVGRSNKIEATILQLVNITTEVSSINVKCNLKHNMKIL